MGSKQMGNGRNTNGKVNVKMGGKQLWENVGSCGEWKSARGKATWLRLLSHLTLASQTFNRIPYITAQPGPGNILAQESFIRVIMLYTSQYIY